MLHQDCVLTLAEVHVSQPGLGALPSSPLLCQLLQPAGRAELLLCLVLGADAVLFEPRASWAKLALLEDNVGPTVRRPN